MATMRNLLKESTNYMKNLGVNTYSDYRTIMSEDVLFDHYKESLAEGLEGETKQSFMEVADLLKGSMISENTIQFNPVAPLTFPIFRKFWPMLVTREAVTVVPIDKSEVVKSFLRLVANVNGADVEVPNMGTSVSTPYAFGDSMDFPAYEFVLGEDDNRADLLKHVDPAFTPALAHVNSAEFNVGSAVAIIDGVQQTVDVYCVPDGAGNFAFEVPCGSDSNGAPIIDTVSGNINYATGIFAASSTRFAADDNKVYSIILNGSVSTFEEMKSNSVSLRMTNIPLRAEDLMVQANWSIQMEQDFKAYFDIDVQTQLVDTMGKLIAMDTDRKVLRKLLNETKRFNPTSCGTGVSGDVFTFDKTPDKDQNFAFGKKEWNSQIIVNLNNLSAKIYNDALMTTQPNIIIANPFDVAIFKNMNDNSFNGNLPQGGDFGDSPVAGTINNVWKVLSTSLMPIGEMLVMVKPEAEQDAVFIYAPYKPLVVSPWPLGNKPSMSFLSRFATRFIRREGVGVLKVIETK